MLQASAARHWGQKGLGGGGGGAWIARWRNPCNVRQDQPEHRLAGYQQPATSFTSKTQGARVLAAGSEDGVLHAVQQDAVLCVHAVLSLLKHN